MLQFFILFVYIYYIFQRRLLSYRKTYVSSAWPQVQQNSLQQLSLCACSRISQADIACPHCALQKKSVMQIYSKTRLNIHPCLYDAYGMTVVEAASQGGHPSKPSVLKVRCCHFCPGCCYQSQLHLLLVTACLTAHSQAVLDLRGFAAFFSHVA